MPLLTSSGLGVTSVTTQPTTPPSLGDWMYQFKDQGIQINGPSTADFYDVQEITGLDMPTTKLTTVDIDGRHGSAVRSKYFKERTIVMTLCAYVVNSNIQSMIDNMKTNMYPDDNVYPFYFKHGGVGMRVIFCKSQGLSFNHDKDNNTNQQTMQLTLVAEDPRAYSVDLTTLTSTFPQATLSGRGYPRTYPRTYGVEVSGGLYDVDNIGSMDTEPLYTTNDACTNITIQNGISNATIYIPIVMAVGDVLQVDTQQRAVFLNGIRYSNYQLTGGWPVALPGHNPISMTATSAGSTTTSSIAFRSAWS